MLWLCLSVLAFGRPAGAQEAAPPADAAGQAQRQLDLSSPRATMREFLVAMQDARGDHPERIDDAVECLDTSRLEGEGEALLEKALPLAQRLYDLINKLKVNLDDVPEEATESYPFYPREPEEGAATPIIAPTKAAGPEIRIALNAAMGRWQFTAHTLESIPALEEQVGKVEAPAPVKSDVPAARRNPRATMQAFLEATNAEPRDNAAAVQCLDPTGQDPDAWPIRGPMLAQKLKAVMDRIKVVVLPEVPDDPEGPPYAFYTSEIGNIVIGRIEQAAGDLKAGEWRFTPRTLKALDVLYEAHKGRDILEALAQAGVKDTRSLGLRLQDRFPQSWQRSSMGLKVWQWLVLVAVLIVGWVIKRVAAWLFMLLGWLWFRRQRVVIDRDVRRRAFRSTGAVVTVLFWLWAVRYLDLPAGLLSVLVPVLQFGLAITIGLVGYRLVDGVGSYLLSNKEVQLTRFDDLLVPMLKKILRAVVVVIAILFVLHLLGQPPSVVLGALGIGGVALAFGAQDTVSNFLGSLTVLFDRPFGIGDWICMGDVDGTVERVGFRSTRVRTFYNSVVTIPNSKIVNTQVDNYGARRYRRIRVIVSITYSTPPDKIDAFCEGIRELIRLHPYTRKDYYHVYLNQFAASSLDILLYCFVETPDWSTELRERHRLFVDILRLADTLGVEFAFPTRTVWLEQAAEPTAKPAGETQASGREDPEVVGLDHAAKVFDDAYGPTPTVPGPVVTHQTPRSKRSGSQCPKTGDL